jgi:hypothetical protein
MFSLLPFMHNQFGHGFVMICFQAGIAFALSFVRASARLLICADR